MANPCVGRIIHQFYLIKENKKCRKKNYCYCNSYGDI